MSVQVVVLPVQVDISNIFLRDVWLFEHMVVRLEVLNLGFGVQNPLIEQDADVLDRCLFVCVLHESLSDSVSVMTMVVVGIHVLHSILNPRIQLLCLHFSIVQVLIRHLKLL
jgi:hypothetical protein